MSKQNLNIRDVLLIFSTNLFQFLQDHVKLITYDHTLYSIIKSRLLYHVNIGIVMILFFNITCFVSKSFMSQYLSKYVSFYPYILLAIVLFYAVLTLYH